MVGQHDATGPDPDRLGGTSDIADGDGGRSAGNTGHIVVLGQPIAVEAQAFGMPGEVSRVAEGIGGGRALGNRCKIENGERNHEACPCPGGEGTASDRCRAENAVAIADASLIIWRRAASIPCLMSIPGSRPGCPRTAAVSALRLIVLP